MKVLILGSSGVIGQHMRLCVPPGVEPVWHRRRADLLHVGADLADPLEAVGLLNKVQPAVVVNLAGDNDTDGRGAEIAVGRIASWCDANGAHLIHVSTQAVFSGEEPPYGPDTPATPINDYGWRKLKEECRIKALAENWTIVRPTFVLGVRPMPGIGRKNPIEQMLGGQPRQVNDRLFSPLFARDAASLLWQSVVNRPKGKIVHLGNPEAVSRYDVAKALGLEVEACSHDDFLGLAPRPKNTQYWGGLWLTGMSDGLTDCKLDYFGAESMDARQRAREIGVFLGMTEQAARARLFEGFPALHQAVAVEWRRAKVDGDPARILEWYRETEAYIWELSAYHCDRGFNYAGMMEGVARRLSDEGARRVLCLGDGIGDLTLYLERCGFDAVYHDLAGSRTAAFARFMYYAHTGDEIVSRETADWSPEPIATGDFDAVVSLDFLEHVPNVPEWTAAIKRALKPGGLMLAQNAFGMGSGPRGSIPCHLPENDRFEREWTPLLASLQFRQEGTSNWWRA